MPNWKLRRWRRGPPSDADLYPPDVSTAVGIISRSNANTEAFAIGRNGYLICRNDCIGHPARLATSYKHIICRRHAPNRPAVIEGGVIDRHSIPARSKSK